MLARIISFSYSNGFVCQVSQPIIASAADMMEFALDVLYATERLVAFLVFFAL
jgi:hypothetical protein